MNNLDSRLPELSGLVGLVLLVLLVIAVYCLVLWVVVAVRAVRDAEALRASLALREEYQRTSFSVGLCAILALGFFAIVATLGG